MMKTVNLIQKRIIQMKRMNYEPGRICFTFKSWVKFQKENKEIINYSLFPDLPIAKIFGLDVEIYRSMPCDFIIEDKQKKILFGGRRVRNSR